MPDIPVLCDEDDSGTHCTIKCIIVGLVIVVVFGFLVCWSNGCFS